MQATSAKLFRNLSQVRSEVKCSFTLLVFSYRPAALCWPPGSPRMGAMRPSPALQKDLRHSFRVSKRIRIHRQIIRHLNLCSRTHGVDIL